MRLWRNVNVGQSVAQHLRNSLELFGTPVARLPSLAVGLHGVGAVITRMAGWTSRPPAALQHLLPGYPDHSLADQGGFDVVFTLRASCLAAVSGTRPDGARDISCVDIRCPEHPVPVFSNSQRLRIRELALGGVNPCIHEEAVQRGIEPVNDSWNPPASTRSTSLSPSKSKM